MKRTYQLKNLDCPTCAALMEESIRSVKGIESASISFMTGRMVLEGDIDAPSQIHLPQRGRQESFRQGSWLSLWESCHRR